jgi:type VI secretion system protein ImpA
MTLDIGHLLEPLDAEEPYGPDLRDLPQGDYLRELAASEEQVDWGRQQERALDLAERCRDMRAWVWLARAKLAGEGLGGLAEGLALIAEGLERHWDALPPIDPDESHPQERFMGRLSALSGLGVSSSLFRPSELEKRRDVYFLAQELDMLVARAEPSAELDAAVGRIEQAMDRIARVVRERFGDGLDPQLGFELIASKLAALKARAGGDQPAGAGAHAGPQPGRAPVPGGALGPVASRDDVVRALNLVLDYYRLHEPSSPVPLLVDRAKKLVSMSFVEAIKEIAPGGMKELALVAGMQDDTKGKKSGD